jgi:hypothetical protein
MSKQHFSWLLVATLVVGTLIFLLPGKTSKESEFKVRSLLPDLAVQVNGINRVTVKAAGDTTVATLKRLDDAWVVEEFHDYPADWPKLRELLAALAKARIIEPKTSNAEYFPRLGVSDIANEDSQAILLQLQADGSDRAVLVGNAAEGREGQYVRLLEGEQALLIDQQLAVPAEAKDWLQADIINVSDAEVVEFSVLHADGSGIKGSKTSADDEDFTLQDIPAGREVLSAWSVNSMANALSNLQLDAVAPADTVDFSTASQFRLLTADGLQVLAELVELDEQSWLRISASSYTDESVETDSPDPEAETEAEVTSEADAPIADAAADAAADVAADATDSDPPDQADEPEADAKQRAAEINQRVSGWAYAIPSFKADAMNKQLEELLKPLPQSE